MFVLLTAAVVLLRGKGRFFLVQIPPLLRFAIVILVISYLASLWTGLVPLEPIDANAFANYFSRYNSLRVAKGFFWAIVLFLVVPAGTASGEFDPRRLLSVGMILGLVGVNCAVVYERFKFAGLFNFSTDHRAIATFSGLHNGGNDIEAYLVLAMPFILHWALAGRALSRYLCGAVLFGWTSYSLLVTFSRGGYLGFIVSWLVLILSLIVASRARGWTPAPMRGLPFAFFLVLLGAAVALPILKGDFIRARFATVSIDWQSRVDQLWNTFRMMDKSITTLVFGMGLGRFPAIYSATQPEAARPTVYTFVNEGGNRFVRIRSGSPLYFGQWINVKPGKFYVLSIDLRSVNRTGELSLPICEKQLQKSYRCHWLRLQTSGVGGWEHFERRFNLGEVGGDIGRVAGRLSRRPVELALYNAGRGSIVDIDNVRLIDESGDDLISNGTFDRGHDRWFFTVDDLMPWQSSNHWGQIYFEQGWLGLIAFNAFVVVISLYLFARVRHGDVFSATALAGAYGFLTVGLFGSLFDTPRLAALFYFCSVLPFLATDSPAAVPRDHY